MACVVTRHAVGLKLSADGSCKRRIEIVWLGIARIVVHRVLETLVRLDNLWRMPFPYVMVLHQAPTNGQAHPGFHFHIQIHTPLRKPGVLKYLAGPEIGGGNFLNDTAPEEKAAELRAVSAVHYRAEPS